MLRSSSVSISLLHGDRHKKGEAEMGIQKNSLSFPTHHIGTFCIPQALNNNGKMFAFSIIFGIAFYLVLILSRFLELSILKHYRAKVNNSRTAIFVGNDPGHCGDVQDNDRRPINRLLYQRLLRRCRYHQCTL